MTTQSLTNIIDKYESEALTLGMTDLAIKLNWVRNALVTGQIDLSDMVERILQLTILNK